MRATRERLVEAARRSAIHLGGQADLGILMSPEARSAVERAGGADGRNELVTFQRLFLCLSSSSSLLFSAAVSLQHWKPSIHPSKTVSGVVARARLLCACAQVLPIGVGGTFDRPRKTLIKKPLNGGRDLFQRPSEQMLLLPSR